MAWQTIKTVGISMVLLIPTLHGMQELKTNVESLPVYLRHRGYTKLHIAAYYGHLEKITQLIASNVVVDARSVNRSTPLHLAAERGHVGAVEALIAELKRINSYACPLAHQATDIPSIVDIQDAAGATPLAYAAANGHTDVVRCLIAKGARIGVADRQGYLPFHKAAQNGDLEALKILLPDGAGENHAFCEKALHCAVKSGKTDVLAYVMNITKGRHDPEGGYQIVGGSMHATPLLLAAALGYPSLMEYYLAQEGSRIDDRDRDGASALHYAARYGQGEATQFLLERNPELINIRKKGHRKCLGVWKRLDKLPGGTALHEAAAGGHSEVVKLLLQHNAEIDAKLAYGSETPLHLAAEEGHTQVLGLLIDAGASLTATDIYGFQPLHLAARAGQKGCVEALLRNKADIEAKDSSNRTPLLRAAGSGHLETIKCLLQHGADIKCESDRCLLQHGADIKCESDHFGNALSCAISCNKEAATNYLFHHPEVELMSCIFHAARSGNYKAMELFIKKGASLDTQLDDGRTVLHCAVEAVNNDGFGMYGTVRLLIRAGADMLRRDDAGNTPLYSCKGRSNLLETKTYFENRRVYLSGSIPPGDTIDSVFLVAADFLDIPVLEALKDQLGDRLMQWRKDGKNLLMVALTATDFDGVNWLLDQKICDITDVDGENHDVLWLAIKNKSLEINARKLAVVNRLLEGGARVTEDHLLEAASSGHETVNEVLMRLLVTYRYSQRHENERLSLFR